MLRFIEKPVICFTQQKILVYIYCRVRTLRLTTQRQMLTFCSLYHFLIQQSLKVLRISLQNDNTVLEGKIMSQHYAKISEIEYFKEFSFCKVTRPLRILNYFPVILTCGKEELSYYHWVCLKICGFKISKIRWWNFSFITSWSHDVN